MYRIIYSPRKAGWIIQISSFMIFWIKINDTAYGNFADAKAHVMNIGLDKIYRNYNDRPNNHNNNPVLDTTIDDEINQTEVILDRFFKKLIANAINSGNA